METDIVTGAGGYLGRYIATRLIQGGRAVASLTGHPDRLASLPAQVRAIPYTFDDPVAMARAMAGAEVLYNTYWVRFRYGSVSHERAVHNSRQLFEAARRSGIRRIVHVSITEPHPDSRLPYFRGKALVERALEESGLPYSIIRPTVLFGAEDILLNNIAWLLRRLPVFGVPEGGHYPLQPAFVDDVAALAVEQATGDARVRLDAVGPETLTFAELVALIRDALHARARLVPVPSRVALGAARIAGWAVRDVVLTADELRGLMDGLLTSPDAPTCATRLSTWLVENARTLGANYHSELARHYA